MENAELGHPDSVDSIKLEPGDEHYQSPTNGGCWICHGDTAAKPSEIDFDGEFDTFYHTYCLGYVGVDSILEYERGDWENE
jgi:hypothetical protein